MIGTENNRKINNDVTIIPKTLITTKTGFEIIRKRVELIIIKTNSVINPKTNAFIEIVGKNKWHLFDR